MCGVCAGVRGCAQVCVGVHGCAQVCPGMRKCTYMYMGVCGCEWVGVAVHGCVWKCAGVCECVCWMNFQNIFWRLESIHQRTLIRILYEFFIKFILLKNQLGFKKRKLKESSEHDDIINIMEESNYQGMFIV